jgi:tRNA G18 (ribose-2'-O)-methylase SpoU
MSSVQPATQPRLVRVTEASDARLADYVRLRDTSLRKHLESEHGLFIAEGAKVIRRALEAGFRPRSFLLSERWLPSLADLLERTEAPVFVVSEELAEEVTGFHVHRGALASVHREQRHQVADLLALRRLVVLEDIVDHTNVGAVLRNAAGLGWDGALLSPRSADPLYRRAIKVSMGAVFSLPWARAPSWHATPAMLTEAGFETVALTLDEDAQSLVGFADEVRRHPRRLAILLGTEGAGLSAHWTARANQRVRISMHAGVDSLNVAAATAIACYSLSERGETGQSAG